MIFIDTGAFYARYIAKDSYHEKAEKIWQYIAENKQKCVTSNFILDELFTLLGRKVNYQFAADKAKLIYTSKNIQILRPEQNDELAAIHLFEKYADQQISYTDCISFVLAKKNKIQRIFSFDHHFTLAGFILEK